MRVRSLLVRAIGAVGLGMLITGAVAAIAPGEPRAGRGSELFFTTTPFGRGGQIWSARSDGSRPRLVRGSLPVGPATVTAVLSQDRRRILCVCRTGEIDSMRLDGSHLRRIGHEPRRAVEEGVVLGPSGQILWELDNGRIVTQRANGTQRHLVKKVGRGGLEGGIALSPDGSRVAFLQEKCSRSGCAEALAVVRLDGTGLKTIFRDQPGRFIESPSWSSDGTTLAFAEALELEKGVEGNFQSDVYTVGSHGSSLQNVTQSLESSEYSPVFSPDGSRLAFIGISSRGYNQLFTVGVSGGRPTRVVQTKCRLPNCEYEPAVIGWANLRG